MDCKEIGKVTQNADNHFIYKIIQLLSYFRISENIIIHSMATRKHAI